MIATSGFLTALECTKFVFRRPGLRGGRLQRSSRLLSWFKGAYTSKGEGRGREEKEMRRGEEGKSRGGKGPAPFANFWIRPWNVNDVSAPSGISLPKLL